MIHNACFFFTLAAALGCGLIAGVFFAFSNFVMGALARLPAVQGIAAMQSINVVVINPLFLGVFLGTVALCIGAVVTSLFTGFNLAVLWLVAGAVLYTFGTVVVTMAFNVPRNEALMLVDPASSGAAAFWAEYVARWTAWNHVRTVAALAAAACLTIGLRLSNAVGAAQ